LHRLHGGRSCRNPIPASPPACAPPPGAAPPGKAQIEAARLAMQPLLRELTDRACVVYALN